MIIEKQLLLEMFDDESLEMIVDESLEMIEDESLDMIVDEPLMVEDKSLEKLVDETLKHDEEHFESVIADWLKGRVNRLLIKGVIRDGTGRRNKNRRTKAGGRRKRDGFLKEITLRGQLAGIIPEGFGIVKGVAHGVANNVPAFKSMITYLTKNDANEAFDRFNSPKSVTSIDNNVTETA
ncbi:hypothetical protein Tco_0748189 [Tanacetum coccineum]|uniref:Uncharacterized protein n=1 Tax=Tanacetum coccineum TaxID=301880 RepID=A0ABQ4YXX2_9ASTR